MKIDWPFARTVMVEPVIIGEGRAVLFNRLADGLLVVGKGEIH